MNKNFLFLFFYSYAAIDEYDSTADYFVKCVSADRWFSFKIFKGLIELFYEFYEISDAAVRSNFSVFLSLFIQFYNLRALTF